MDELRRNAKLISEILSRASIIENSMSDTTARLENIKQVEENHINKLQQQQEQENSTHLNCFAALTDDIVFKILYKITNVQDLLSICQVNKRFEMLALRNEEFWKSKCAMDWNIGIKNPNHANHLKQIVLQKYEGIMDKVQKGQIMYNCNNNNNEQQIISWQELYQDRYRGKNLVSRILHWLREKNHPSDVTGQIHKIQLLIALEYLILFVGKEFQNSFHKNINNTFQYDDYSTLEQQQLQQQQIKELNVINNHNSENYEHFFSTPTPSSQIQNYKSVYEDIFQQTTVQSMLALLENKNQFVLDLALQILLNVGFLSQQLLQYLIEQSSNGRQIVNLLNSKDDQVVKSATKLLIFMWLQEKISDINLNKQIDLNANLLSSIVGSNLVLQELSSRGKILRSHLLVLYYDKLNKSNIFSSSSYKNAANNSQHSDQNNNLGQISYIHEQKQNIEKVDNNNNNILQVRGEGFVVPDVKNIITVNGSINVQQMTVQFVIFDIDLNQKINLRGWIGEDRIFGVYQYQRLEGAGQQFVVSQEVLPRIFSVFVND